MEDCPRWVAALGARRGRTMLRFAAVGASGVLVNLGALHLCAAVLRMPELIASAIAVEVSILSNFALNDGFTFRDRRTASWPVRLVRYHAVSAVGMGLQLGVFAGAVLAASRAGWPELGNARYPVQAAGIALAFVWSWLASSRWAWGPAGAAARRAAPARSAGARLAIGAFVALLALHLAPIWLVPWVPTQDGPLHVENVLALMNWSASPLLQRTYLTNWASRIGDVEYVLVSGATRENLDTPCGAALASELTSRYEPVFLSQPTGLLEIWRPKVTVAGR